MLNSLLSLFPTVVRRGMALTRFCAAGRRFRTGPRALRTNGRMSSLTGPIVLLARFPSESFTGFSLRANGRRLLTAGPRTSASSPVRSSALRVVLSVGPSSSTVRRTSGDWLAIAPSAWLEATSSCSIPSPSCPTRPHSRFMLWISLARFSFRVATSELRRARPRLIGPRLPRSSPRSLPRPSSPWPPPTSRRRRYDRVPVLVVDLGDVADPDARDPDRLPLTRGDRLSGLHLGPQLERLLLQERDPEALVLDDDVRRDQAHDEQAEDGEEVTQMVADRVGHQRLPAFPSETRGGFRPFSLWSARHSVLHTSNNSTASATIRSASACLPSAPSCFACSNWPRISAYRRVSCAFSEDSP